MSYVMSDLHTDETFPIADYSIADVLTLIEGEMEGIFEEPWRKWSPGTGETITELLAIRDALFELVQNSDGMIDTGNRFNEGLLRQFEQTWNVKEYLDGVGEQQLRTFIWNDLSERCATCREFMDYCQGHGVLG